MSDTPQPNVAQPDTPQSYVPRHFVPQPDVTKTSTSEPHASSMNDSQPDGPAAEEPAANDSLPCDSQSAESSADDTPQPDSPQPAQPVIERKPPRGLRRLIATPRARIICVAVLMSLAWGAMVLCQGLREPYCAADWAIMSEVGRHVALGDTLYVDTLDQKGPLCYATYALLFKLFHTSEAVYVVSNVLIWIILVFSTVIAARMVEDEGRPWIHPLAQGLLIGVLIVPHAGCVETWLLPLGLLTAMWARRLTRGHTIPLGCWVFVGMAAAYAFWSKFTCTAQFAFVLGYAASQENTKGLGKAALIALASFAAVSVVVLAWMWFGGSFEGMLRHYLFAASDGYAERMNMFKYMQGDNPSTTHMSSFFVGLPLSLWALAVVTWHAKRKLPVLITGAGLIACCFVAFVGYYRFQLATLVILAACDTGGRLWNLKPIAWVSRTARTKGGLLWVPALVAIVCSTYFCCHGTQATMARAAQTKQVLRDAVGDSDSVLVWQFGNTWVYAELGLDYPYASPARYNASHDLWDSTAGVDVSAGRWNYVIASVGSKAKVGDVVTLVDKKYPIVGLNDGVAIADCSGGDEEFLHNEPYQIP